MNPVIDHRVQKETAILVGVGIPGGSPFGIDQSLDELEQLVVAAGGEVVARLVQARNTPDANTFIGTGKINEVNDLVRSLQAKMVVFDNDLTPAQQNNLENKIDTNVLDRTAIILAVFAGRAHSNEGKLQVELAQLFYRLPRLRGKGIEMSRLGGGIGTRRGPGETKLEIDRRRIRLRIKHLKKELESVAQSRSIQRKRRKKIQVFSVSLVGYTNAGKSTLLNALTDSHVFVEDKLFATLDSTTRRLGHVNQQPVVISDTVGFIQKLPTQLIAAFRSTLDEVREASLLLHVVDGSNVLFEAQIKAVEEVLEELETSEKPRLTVFNKIDRLADKDLKRLRNRYPEAVFVSALARSGLGSLRSKIFSMFDTLSLDDRPKDRLEV